MIQVGLAAEVGGSVAASHGKAPFGYYNEPRRRTIVPNRRSFKKIKTVLERFATGTYSLTALQREFAKAGVVGKESKKPLTLSSISRVLHPRDAGR